MKQKLLDKILYVFSVEPYEITEDADSADVIKVQQETYEGFIALNPDLADKIVKYNYHILTVSQLEWAPYVDEPDPEPEPELPESGTMYDFIGYATEDASEPASSGTITYEGEYSENTDYVYGDATVTFVGSDSERQLTVYMTKDDLLTALDGGRSPVYTMQSDQLVPLGYGELFEYSAGDTECTVTLTGTGVSDTYINVEVGGSLITDFTDYIDQETGDVLFTVNALDEIKIYPLDNQENYSIVCADAEVTADDSDQYYWYVAIPNDTTITVDYTDPNPR